MTNAQKLKAIKDNARQACRAVVENITTGWSLRATLLHYVSQLDVSDAPIGIAEDKKSTITPYLKNIFAERMGFDQGWANLVQDTDADGNQVTNPGKTNTMQSVLRELMQVIIWANKKSPWMDNKGHKSNHAVVIAPSTDEDGNILANQPASTGNIYISNLAVPEKLRDENSPHYLSVSYSQLVKFASMYFSESQDRKSRLLSALKYINDYEANLDGDDFVLPADVQLEPEQIEMAYMQLDSMLEKAKLAYKDIIWTEEEHSEIEWREEEEETNTDVELGNVHDEPMPANTAAA